MVDRLLGILRVLLTPKCWFQNESYSDTWDALLCKLMQTSNFEEISEHYTTIGGRRLWVANHPYASFTLEPLSVRPKRITVLRAKDKLIADLLASAKS